MKFGTLRKAIIETRYTIIVQNRDYERIVVDYLAAGIGKDNIGKAQALAKATVVFVSINSATGMLEISVNE